MQLLIAISFSSWINYSFESFFVISLAIFWLPHFASASNDVASDGFYLSSWRDNLFFFFIRSTFYRLSMLTGK
jgi:PAT family beta-lactamase induction signal transducer AmpG